MILKFTKMHGLGNDFVVINATTQPFSLNAAQIRQLADRRHGVGCDQVLALEASQQDGVDFHYRIFNADGSEVEQCGNGARCMALFISEQNLSEKRRFVLSTKTGLIELELTDDNQVRVNMGAPRFEPQQIPLLADNMQDLYSAEINGKTIKFAAVNLGNPHAVIIVEDLQQTDVAKIGKELSQHRLFPQNCNVGFMQVINPQHIKLSVYERGAGETLACGSGACAAVVIGRRDGILKERVTADQPGGSLVIDWQGPNSSVIMSGSAQTSFTGQWYGGGC